MSLKQNIENHIGLVVLGALVTGFVSGWGAHIALQNASGQTTISIDRLKQLEHPIDKSALQTRLEELELERADLMQRLNRNRPTTGNYVHNVVITPQSPAVLGVGASITVRFEYVLMSGQEGHIWASADGPTDYYGSEVVSGSGTAERQITTRGVGKVREVTILMGSRDGQQLYEMKLPVDFIVK